MTKGAPSHPILADAERLAVVARERAEEVESGRCVPADVVAALREAGLLRMCVPTAYDGPEVDPLSMMQAIQTVGYGDGSVGWCVMIASTTSSLSVFLPPDVASAVFGDPTTVSGGAFAPTATATTVDGGFRVTGQWMWGSGTDHCNWIVGGAIVDGSTMRLMFFPRSDVELVDTWYSSGLRGTASNDFRVRDVFVPTDHTITPLASRSHVDVPLARFPNFTLLACGVAAATLGIARRAIDELLTLAQAKIPVQSAKRLAEWSMAQVDIARAEAALSSARAFLVDEVGEAWDTVLAGDRVSGAQRARIRLACSNVGTQAAYATDLAYNAGGGSSVFATSPLQRCFRDVHTATQHVMVAPRMYETFGKLAMGVEVETAML